MNSDSRVKIMRIKDLPLAYYQAGEGRPVVLLHGWGTEAASFAPVAKYLAAHFAVYSLDLPGFGLTPTPPKAWTVYDYADLVEEFLRHLHLESPILIGHSFGGRLGIILGARGIPHKMVLVDSAGIRPARGWQYYVKVYSYKGAKKLLSLPVLRIWGQKILDGWAQKAGSSDYRQAQGTLRQSFVYVVNEDLRHLLPQITAPTLLVWGSLDEATPLSDGELMEQLIPGSGLAVLEGAGHYSFLERLPQFLRILESFLAQEIKGA